MSYLIKDTTKEQRQNIVNDALAISLLGADKPSEEVIKLLETYVNGEIEVDEITKKIIESYQ